MMRRWMALGLVGLASCYSSAQAARVDQTRRAYGFRCAGPPRVRCPNRADGRCTGWDTTWVAECASDNAAYNCRLDRDGDSFCDRTGIASGGQRPPTQPQQAAPGTELEATVEAEVDEFTGRRRVEFRTQVLIERDDGTTQLAGRDRLVLHQEGEINLFNHMSHGDRWAYLRCHPLHMLIDGQRVPLPEPDHQGSTTPRGVVEAVAVSLNSELLQRILHAQSLRYRICNDVYRVPVSTLTRWRQRATELGLLGAAPTTEANPFDADEDGESEPEAEHE